MNLPSKHILSWDAFGFPDHRRESDKYLTNCETSIRWLLSQSLFEKLKAMEVFKYYESDNYSIMDYDFCSMRRKCSVVKKPLEAKIKELEQKIKGFELTDGISSS